MALVNFDFIVKIQEVRKAYLEAEDRDVAARAVRKKALTKADASSEADGKPRRPSVMTNAPESFMTQFKFTDPA